MNDQSGRGLERFIMVAAGLVMLAAMFILWAARGVDPNAVFVGVSMILLGYGDKLRRDGGG